MGVFMIKALGDVIIISYLDTIMFYMDTVQ